jgi:hypothetical protein
VIGDLTVLSLETRKEIVDRLNWTKYIGWSYEQEIRLWGSRAEADPETGLYFVDFGPALQLKEVIVGAKCRVTKQEIESALEGYQDVMITKVCPNPRRFEMIIDDRGFDQPRQT